MKTKSFKPGQITLGEPRIKRVRCDPSALIVDFEDGRTLHIPLVWFPRLFRATQTQRSHWELIGPGIGVHWPDVDEDLSAEGLLAGRPSIEYIRQIRKGRKDQEVPA
ncbi:MAG: DUF2442 domain-containing protein [Verrucomicrobia bacterium]|nr:DUF2442 domain-containing protein [Verrucomicrobiota bacterium]